MDWLWPIYEEHVRRGLGPAGDPSVTDAMVGDAFLTALSESGATAYVMEPVGTTIRFKGLGRWPLSEVPDLVTDPNAFISARWGGGKFKVNFHHVISFVGTHNFRTYSEDKWRTLEELDLA